MALEIVLPKNLQSPGPARPVKTSFSSLNEATASPQQDKTAFSSPESKPEESHFSGKPIKILKDVKLSNYTTMRVGGEAQFLAEVANTEELIEALELAKQKNLDFFVLGGGSNTIFTDGGFKGLIILNKIGCDLKFKLEDNTVTASADAN